MYICLLIVLKLQISIKIALQQRAVSLSTYIECVKYDLIELSVLVLYDTSFQFAQLSHSREYFLYLRKNPFIFFQNKAESEISSKFFPKENHVRVKIA